MVKVKRKYWWILGLVVFVVYFFVAARPIQEETVLIPRWITSLEADYPISLGNLPVSWGDPLPFRLGYRYGFVEHDGRFAVNNIAQGYVSLSERFWAEYASDPSSLQIMNPRNELVLNIENPRGFPLFLDNRIFMVGIEQNSLTAIGPGGEELWHHDFRSPITVVDAAGGRVLAGTLDGAIELLDSQGRPVITPFEPGGSRLQSIFGVALSGDASRLAVISGIDNQRFLLLEQAADLFRVVHHEFLGSGFRRPVHITFADNDRKVVFEREGGLGIFDIASRSGVNLPLEGEIKALDDSGEYPYFFVVTSQGQNQKRFVTIRYPGVIIIDAPFRSDTAFFARRDGRLYLGGDYTMASFELGRR